MKFKCNDCTFSSETYSQLQTHQKATGHKAYITIRSESIDLEDKGLFDYLAKKYEQQMKYAIELANVVMQRAEINFAEKQAHLYYQYAVQHSILDKILTPGIYLRDEYLANTKDEKKKE